MKKDRIQLLLELIFKDKETVLEMFDKLVPKFQVELYVLYNILDKANSLSADISLIDIGTDMITVIVKADTWNIDTIRTIIFDNNVGHFKPFKNHNGVFALVNNTDGKIVIGKKRSNTELLVSLMME